MGCGRVHMQTTGHASYKFFRGCCLPHQLWSAPPVPVAWGLGLGFCSASLSLVEGAISLFSMVRSSALVFVADMWFPYANVLLMKVTQSFSGSGCNSMDAPTSHICCQNGWPSMISCNRLTGLNSNPGWRGELPSLSSKFSRLISFSFSSAKF